VAVLAGVTFHGEAAAGRGNGGGRDAATGRYRQAGQLEVETLPPDAVRVMCIGERVAKQAAVLSALFKETDAALHQVVHGMPEISGVFCLIRREQVTAVTRIRLRDERQPIGRVAVRRWFCVICPQDQRRDGKQSRSEQ
jgi:hypothetical protein